MVPLGVGGARFPYTTLFRSVKLTCPVTGHTVAAQLTVTVPLYVFCARPAALTVIERPTWAGATGIVPLVGLTENGLAHDEIAVTAKLTTVPAAIERIQPVDE